MMKRSRTTPELRHGRDRLRFADERKPRGADDDPGREVSQDRAETEQAKQRHGNHCRAAERQDGRQEADVGGGVPWHPSNEAAILFRKTRRGLMPHLSRRVRLGFRRERFFADCRRMRGHAETRRIASPRLTARGFVSPHRLIMTKPPLDILLCAPRGFCAGVVRAIDAVERALRSTARRSMCGTRSSTTSTWSRT